jgi:hypothetical protein
MRITKIRGYCPYCFRRAATATDREGDERPWSGDIGICNACGGVHIYNFKRRANCMRKPEHKEWALIESNASYRRLRQLLTAERIAS